MKSQKEMTELVRAMTDLEEEKTYEILERYMTDNKPPLQIIDALTAGMDEVGRLYKEGEYFLGELVFSGEIFKNSLARVKPLLEKHDSGKRDGKLIMGTVSGDIHDLGKNIVITLLECAGFEVVDIGVDVPPEKFVEALRDSKARLVGLSTLLTTSFSSMRETIDAIAEAGLRDRVKIMIGGGSTSDRLREQIGADYHGSDATDAVAFAKTVIR